MHFSYSWYACTLVVPNVIVTTSYRFAFHCNSSFNENNSLYNVVCKYHPNPYDAKILPKRSQVARNRCFTKLDNTSVYSGVSGHLLLI